MIEEYGKYESSYFIMSVPLEADLEIKNMTKRDFAVFFHEYIHFLQDITSFYGYMGIYSHGEYMRRAINDIYKMSQNVVMPITIEEKGDCVLLNKAISKFSIGDKGDFDFVVINNVAKDVFIEYLQLTDSFSIPELHVKAITNHGQEELIVGAYAIKENMAYLLERICTTGYRTSSDYPYQIVEILAESMCPGKLSTLDLIALCDIALQSSVPGHGLFLMLKGICDGSMVVKKPEDIYDFYYSKRTNFLGQKMETPRALMLAASIARDHLLSYLKIDMLSVEYQDWICYTLQAGVEMRIRRPYFFLDMARGKKDKDNIVLQYIAKHIGSPQMVNKLGKRFQLVTNRPICRFEYLEAVREIEQLFEYGEHICSLKPWCEMSLEEAPVDDRCDNAPWSRCNDSQLCPYATLWQHWKLGEKKVIINN